MIDFKDCYDDLVEWYNRLDDKDRSSHIVDCLEALKTLVDKVMPRKVIFNDLGYDHHHNVNVYGAKCPSCDLILFDWTDDDVKDSFDGDIEEMFHDNFVSHGYCGRHQYCDRCGQRLDWSEDE